MDGEKCHRKTHKKYGKPVRFLTVPILFSFAIVFYENNITYNLQKLLS